VDALAGVGSFEEIVAVVEETMAGGHPCRMGDSSAPLEDTPRILSTGPGWAYIKIAEGCDNRCAYCAIPDIRGRFRSREMDSILREAEALAGQGVKELIVVAQDITRYGLDLYGQRCLHLLLRRLCAVEGIEWIRLHYLYPHDVSEELIDEIAAQEKIVKYLDIPIQHIDDAILRRMNRRGDGTEIRALFDRLRARLPGLVLRTSLIVGLPGEGEEEFDRLCDFLREYRIERAGVFPYSPEEGTPAAAMEDRCDEETALRRCEAVMELQAEIMDDFNASRLGMCLRVLCEGEDPDSGYMWGRSWADSPDIDGRVFFDGDAAMAGTFVTVRVTRVMDGDLVGETV